MDRAAKLFRGMIYALPVVLYFSYYPLISFGMNETMNFELSLPLIWLVIFDIVAVVLVVRSGKIRDVVRGWKWLILPAYFTLTLLWSHDRLRGLLIIGVLWLIYIAIFAVFVLREMLSGEFRKRFIKVVLGAGVVMCVWCFVQSILDTAGVPRECTLMCAGCTYKILGFPHPNGFAAEPQFMGNLLILPTLLAMYLFMEDKYISRKMSGVLMAVFMATLFLTLSRGAIYAFVVAMVAFTVIYAIKTRKILVLVPWGIAVVAFLFTLNAQGMMSEFSRTDDTYVSGVSKVINQMSLGVIDLGGSGVKKDNSPELPAGDEAGGEINSGAEGSETKEESAAGVTAEKETDLEESMFDGYIEVSTNERVNSWRGALNVWKKDFATMAFGVGFGSAPLSMYENGQLGTSKEIINNEYISVLLETGVVGVLLVAMTAVMIFKVVYKKNYNGFMLALFVAYGVSLLFFSGLPNALHLYLLPPVMIVVLEEDKMRRGVKKTV